MKQITDEELTAIRERVEKATEGEWRYYPSRLYSHDMICVGDFECQNIAEIRSRESDGVFIAHAREDIPKLLAEIERLKSVISEVITDSIYHETDEEFDKIYRRYLYGGDSE